MTNKKTEDMSRFLRFEAAERRDLIAKGEGLYTGKTTDGEDIIIQVDATGIDLKTFQENGWMRVDYYNENGYHEGQTFQGRWK